MNESMSQMSTITVRRLVQYIGIPLQSRYFSDRTAFLGALSLVVAHTSLNFKNLPKLCTSRTCHTSCGNLSTFPSTFGSAVVRALAVF